MLLGLISDTHGHVAYTLDAVRMLREFDVAMLLNCGDIGSAAVVEALAEWPTHYVFGNCDRGLENSLRGAIERVGHTCHERFGELEFEGLRVAWLHGDDERRLAATISAAATRMSPAARGPATRWQSIRAPCIAPTPAR